MFRKPTLEQTLQNMKTAVQYNNESSSKEDALRSIAEESVVAEVLETIEEREDVSIDLRQKGIDILIAEFESEYPEFDLESSFRENQREKWQDRIRNRKRETWKENYDDGIGPGVFSIECNAERRDKIVDYLDELFPNVDVRVLNYQVSTTPYGRTRVIFRLDETHSVEHLTDHLSIQKLRDLEEPSGKNN